MDVIKTLWYTICFCQIAGIVLAIGFIVKSIYEKPTPVKSQYVHPVRVVDNNYPRGQRVRIRLVPNE